MESRTKECRVCGKKYKACRSANRDDGIFHWREVACSPECGAIYLQRILESRAPQTADKKVKLKKLPKAETVPNESFGPVEEK